MANKGDIYKVALPNGDEYNFKDKYVRENYRALNNNDFDTINVTELNSGNLINTGAARFLNPINGVCTDGTSGTTKYMRQDGTWAVPPNDNTDTKVTQTATTTSANYEVLFSETADNTTRTEAARKSSGLIFNPNTGELTVRNDSSPGTSRISTYGVYVKDCQATPTQSNQFGYYQWGDQVQFTYRNASNTYLGQAFCIYVTDGHSEWNKTAIYKASMYPNTTDTYYSGDSNRKWKGVYATTFYGDLSGNAATATTATKLGTSTVGGITTPIYLNAGVPTALSYTIAKSVPSDALFTDHTYNFSGTTLYSGNQTNSEHNANNIQYNGLYYYTSNGPSKSLGATSDDAAIFAQAYSTSWVSQIASDYRNGNLYTRGKNNGTWQRWRKVRYSDDQFEHSDTVYFDSTTSKIAVNKSTSAWDAQAYSTDGYVDNIMLSFKPNQTNMAMMVGFDSNPSQDAGYTNIDYCWYVHNDAKLTMFESGTEIASISGHTTYVVGDELRVEYSGGYIRYYHNGVLCREVSRAISGKLYFDSSFHGKTSCIYDITFGVATRNATYAASAEKATKDSDGNTINSTYLKLSGGTMTGQIKTSFKSAIAIGSRLSDATTIDNLIADVRYSSGCMGSVSIGTAYTKNGVTIPTGWYNYEWIPHRNGGVNGAANGDNCDYGVLYLSHMTSPSQGTYEISFASSSIAQVRMMTSFTTAPTDAQVVVTDGKYGGVKSSGYTIAKSVPSNAVFTDTTYSAGTGLTLSGTQFSVSSANASTIMNLLTTGSSAPTDNDYYIAQYAGGGTSTTTYHRRPHSALWSYIKGKTDATYLPLAGGTMTGQIVLASTGYKTNSTSGYVVDQYGNFKHQSTGTGEYWVISNNAGTAKLSVYWETGKVVAAGDVQSATVLCANTANSSTAGGLSLYGTDPNTFGVIFRATGDQGKHGYVTSDWATYFTMSNTNNRGWVFRRQSSGNVASIDTSGQMVLNGSLTLGGNSTNTSGVRQVYNATTQSLDFVFVA